MRSRRAALPPTVALVGPDGAGKSTVAAAVLARLNESGVPASSLYMGVSADSANRALPTTRIAHALKRLAGAPADRAGPRAHHTTTETAGSGVRATAKRARAAARLLNRVAEEWYRQLLAWRARRRGEIVLFDRHFLADFHAYDVAGPVRSFDRRVHGYLLSRAYPHPDLTVYLDAPASVLFDRKGEGSIELLERRRADYLQLADVVDRFEVVDADRPLPDVVADVERLVVDEARHRESSARTAPGSKGAVLVTDAGRGSAVAIIRSLGRAGWRVVAADHQRRSPGFRSRYADETVLHPHPASSPAEAGAALAAVARREGVDLVIPITEEARLALHDPGVELPEGCVIAEAPPDGFERTADKWSTVQLAQKCDVPAPRTELVTTVDEAHEAAEALGWPVVIKPRRSRVRHGHQVIDYSVDYANDSDELTRRLAPLEGQVDVLLQQYYPGRGVGVELLMHGGRPLAAFQHERLHEVPPTGGASSLRRSVALDPVLLRHSVALLEELEWTGLAMVEFKDGAEGPMMMEINGRVWGSLPLGVRSGVDFPGGLARLFAGDPPPPVHSPGAYRIGVHSRDLWLEVLWIVEVLAGRGHRPYLPFPARRTALAAALRLADPRWGYDLFSADDPRPFLSALAQLPGRLAAKLRRGLR